jgi:hypothetical protein
VHERLSELVVLLPDIVAKLNNVKADLLLQLLDTKVSDQTGVSSQICLQLQSPESIPEALRICA